MINPLTDDSRWTVRGNEIYWGEPTNDDEQHLVDEQQLQALYRISGV